MQYEILENDIVINTIEAELPFMQENFPLGNYREVVIPTPVEVPPVWQWYIDIGPFFDRFKTAKMQVLTSTDIGVQAIIKDAQVRKWIDLKIPEVAQSLAYIASKIPAITPTLRDDILNLPVQDHENLALRKLYF
jgi:hypothetical protein